MKLSLILFVVLAAKTNCTQIKFQRYVLNSTKYANIETSFENLDSGDVLINSTVELFQDVIKELHAITVKASKSDMDFNYDIEMLKTRIDSCRVSDGVINSIFMKVFLENFANSSNYELKCPFKAGIYKMTDWRITKNHLPPFPRVMFPSGCFGFHIKDDLFGKIAKQKKLVRLYTWELYGKVFDN